MVKISKFLFTALILLVSDCAFAINSEYKNSVSKVELDKANDGSYTVNLYTQKKFLEPVKIIKKSDLNYYILLPETKNTISKTSFNSTDIRSINANSYQYADTSVNNGYTKININTTKPLKFNIKTIDSLAAKTASNTIQKPTAALAAKTPEETKSPAKVQKKNSDFQKEKIQTPKSQTAKKDSLKVDKLTHKPFQKATLVPKKAETKNDRITLKDKKAVKVQPKNKVSTKVADKQVSKSSSKTVKKAVKQAAKLTPKPITKPVKTAPSIEDITQAPVKPLETAPSKDITQAPIEPVQKPFLDEDSELFDQNPIDTLNNETTDEDSLNKNLPDIVQEDASFESSASSDKSSFAGILSSLKEKISNKIAEYGLTVKDVILMMITGVLSFFIMLIILTRKPKNQARLKNKSELIDKLESESLTPKKNVSEKPKNDGRYFVFDKNINHPGLIEPSNTSSGTNFELSSYDPELNRSYQRKEVEISTSYAYENTTSVQSEYDIIQKILKEDTPVDVIPEEFCKKEILPISSPVEKASVEPEFAPVEEIPEVDVIPEAKSSYTPSSSATSPIKSELPSSEISEPAEIEPIVLSKVEIAPERGFMCVSYNNNVNLMGYIFDDVFALYNFKQSELDNYNIKFRMSEKYAKGASFIVKVENTKMLVKVTKSAMSLELAL